MDLGYSFKIRDGTIQPIYNGCNKPNKTITDPLFEDLKRDKETTIKFLQFDKEYFFAQIVSMVDRLNKLQWQNTDAFKYLRYYQNKHYARIHELEQDIDKYFQVHDGQALYRTLVEYENIINDLYKKYGHQKIIKEYVQQDIFTKTA